jgi:hypothetical protein
MDASRIDDLKRRIEDLRDQRARIDYAIELHMAELHAHEAKGQAEERGGEVLKVKPARGGVYYPAEGEVRKGSLPLL